MRHHCRTSAMLLLLAIFQQSILNCGKCVFIVFARRAQPRKLILNLDFSSECRHHHPSPAPSFSWSCDSKYSDQLSDVPLSIILFMSTLFPLLVDLCCQKAYTCKNKLRYFIFPVIFRWCVVLILDCCCKNIFTTYFLFLTLNIFYLTKSSNQIECLF